MAQKKQDRTIDERVSIVREADNRFLEEQQSGPSSSQPSAPRVVYFPSKPETTLADIRKINETKAATQAKEKAENIIQKEKDLNEQASKGFDSLEELGKFNEARKALEDEKTKPSFAAVVSPFEVAPDPPEVPTASTPNIPVSEYNSNVEKFNARAKEVKKQAEEYKETYETFKEAFDTVNTNYSNLENTFEKDFRLFLAEASDRPVVPEDTYIWNKYQSLKKQEEALNTLAKEVNKQGSYLNTFQEANLREIVPQLNNLTKVNAFLSAQGKRYPSAPDTPVEASYEAEKIVEATASKLTPVTKIVPPKVDLLEISERNTERAAQSRALNISMIDRTLENPIGSYGPKTSKEVLELEKKALTKSGSLPRPYVAEDFKAWNDMQAKSSWNTTKEALLALGATKENIKAIEGQAGENYSSVLYSIDGKGNFMLPTENWKEISLLDKEEISKKREQLVNDYYQGIAKDRAITQWRIAVAGDLSKEEQEKYVNSLSEQEKNNLYGYIKANNLLEKDNTKAGDIISSGWNKLSSTTKNLIEQIIENDKSKNKFANVMDISEDSKKAIDAAADWSKTAAANTAKVTGLVGKSIYENFSPPPVVGSFEKDSPAYNYISGVTKEQTENFGNIVEGLKNASFNKNWTAYNEALFQEQEFLNKYKKDVGTAIAKSREKQYQQYKKDLELPEDISKAAKDYITTRKQQEGLTNFYNSELFSSAGFGIRDVLPPNVQAALANTKETIAKTAKTFINPTEYKKDLDSITVAAKPLLRWAAGKEAIYKNGEYVGDKFQNWGSKGEAITDPIKFVFGNAWAIRNSDKLGKAEYAANTAWEYISIFGTDDRRGFGVYFDEKNQPVMTEGSFKVNMAPAPVMDIQIGNTSVGINPLDALFMIIPVPSSSKAKVATNTLSKERIKNLYTALGLKKSVFPVKDLQELADTLGNLNKNQRKKAIELRQAAAETGQTTELAAYYVNSKTGKIVDNIFDPKTLDQSSTMKSLNKAYEKTEGLTREAIEYNPKTNDFIIKKATEFSESDLAKIGGYSPKTIRQMQIASYLKHIEESRRFSFEEALKDPKKFKEIKSAGDIKDISAKDFVKSNITIQHFLKEMFDSLKDLNKDPKDFKDISDGLVKEYFKKVIQEGERLGLGKSKKGDFVWNSQELDELWRNFLSKNLKRTESGKIEPLLKNIDSTGQQNPDFDMGKIFDELDDYYSNQSDFGKFLDTKTPNAPAPATIKPSKPPAAKSPKKTSETGKEASQKAKPATQTAEQFEGPPTTPTALQTSYINKMFDDILDKDLPININKVQALSAGGVPSWIAKGNLKIQPSLSVGDIKAELSRINTPLFTSEKTKDALAQSISNTGTSVKQIQITNPAIRTLEMQLQALKDTQAKPLTTVDIGITRDNFNVPSKKTTDIPSKGKSLVMAKTPTEQAAAIKSVTKMQTPVTTPTKTSSTTKTPSKVKSRVDIPAKITQKVTVKAGVATATKTKTKATTKVPDIPRKTKAVPVKPRKWFIPPIPPVPFASGDPEAEKSLQDPNVNPKIVGWRQGQVYPKVDLEKQTVKFSKKKPAKLKDGKTPRESFTVLKAKKYKPKNKKLSLGKVDAEIKPTGIAFTLKRKDVLSLPSFLKRNKYLKKLK
tara:strand:+ start:417 stop:5291 length:4875 start_codon:yes stop_codon:yes gene_type:complete